MTINDTAEAAHKAASAAMYGGAGVSALSGSSMYFGYTLDQWQVLGIVGGLVIGLLGLIANTAIKVYFNHQLVKIARRKGVIAGGNE